MKYYDMRKKSVTLEIDGNRRDKDRKLRPN